MNACLTPSHPTPPQPTPPHLAPPRSTSPHPAPPHAWLAPPRPVTDLKNTRRRCRSAGPRDHLPPAAGPPPEHLGGRQKQGGAGPGTAAGQRSAHRPRRPPRRPSATLTRPGPTSSRAGAVWLAVPRWVLTCTAAAGTAEYEVHCQQPWGRAEPGLRLRV